jgi:hypothetical protein
MSIPSKQIGWSNESNLLYQILKQLNRLSSIMFGLKPKYKVYTALLTQSGGDNPFNPDGVLLVGVTYLIDDSIVGDDFTNVGGPLITYVGEFVGTYFVATGTTPNNWVGGTGLAGNTGAPVVTVLENTIGNVWFTYDGVGIYSIVSNELFVENKSWYTIFTGDLKNNELYQEMFIDSISSISIQSFSGGTNANSVLTNVPIEIRVYN